jgi:hypothetical protein
MINSQLNFLDSNYQPNLNDPILSKVRGSVRLIMNKFITPAEAKSKFNAVIQKKFFK